jgi:molybdopterin synthase catalytic subunit
MRSRFFRRLEAAKMFQLTQEPIEATALLKAFEDELPDCGAVVSFAGKVRRKANGAEVIKLHLQAYSPMTEDGVTDALERAHLRWPLDAAMIVHRVGDVLPGETIVFVATAAMHRRAAFESADFLMDYLKTEALFWKKESTDKGDSWIEPRAEDHVDRARWLFTKAD